MDASQGTHITIQGNLLYNSTNSAPASAIVSNGSETAPTLTAAISSGGTTTIEGSGPAGATFDFYATNGTLGPAAVYLGSFVGSFPANLSASVPVGASIVATATSAAGDTSAFSSAVSVSNPFAVTNNAASGSGSLEQAIINVNADTGNPNPDTITFAIPSGSLTIKLTSVLTCSPIR